MRLLIVAAMVLAGSVIGAGQASAEGCPPWEMDHWYNACHWEAWTDPNWSPTPQGGQWGPNGYVPCRIQEGCRP
jgi:hypothetical protein